MLQITESLIKQDPTLIPRDELFGATGNMYKSYDDGGVEIEVGEFLYSLVRMVKPKNILETGLYSAISTMYMASAVKSNGHGQIDTVELASEHIQRSTVRLEKLGLLNKVTMHHMSSLEFTPTKPYDIMFLDSEPQIRFSEINRYWDSLLPGGFILIHDLNWHLGVRAEPWEDFVKLLGSKIESHELAVMGFQTPRSMMLLQKYHKDMGHYKLLTGKYKNDKN